MFGALTWAPDTDNAQNKKFVAGYEAAYKAVPASYAMQAYDTAMLIDSAVQVRSKGNVSDAKALSAALRKADFKSLRGPFKFNVNGYPIEDFYLTKVVKRSDGKFQTSIVEKVLTNNADPYAKDCKAHRSGGLALSSFRDGASAPDPESRNMCSACVWIPGSLACARAPE